MEAKIKLHYAKLNLQGDIPCYEFNDFTSFIQFLNKETFDKPGNNVQLMAVEDEIFVADKDSQIISETLLHIYGEGYFTISDTNVFLQEYDSFEEAYSVALDMRETHPLCYEKDLSQLN